MITAFALLSLPVWIIGAALFAIITGTEEDKSGNLWTSFVIVMPIWWAIYFFIAGDPL
jgi:hypothetical protein